MKHVLTRQCFLKLILLNLFCCIAFNAFAVSPVEKIIKESKELKLLVEYFAKSKHNRDELYDFENVNVTVSGSHMKRASGYGSTMKKVISHVNLNGVLLIYLWHPNE